MKDAFDKIIAGYQKFRSKYAESNSTLMPSLGKEGQQPKIMVIACSDSRVDPAILLQCDPGDLFVVRNIANIVPPYEKDTGHHGTSAALEFAVRHLEIKHLIILGHSSCSGFGARIKQIDLKENDFISNWVSQIKIHPDYDLDDWDKSAKESLIFSYENCLSFPWIKERVDNKTLEIHLCFLDIAKAEVDQYDFESKTYLPLSTKTL